MNIHPITQAFRDGSDAYRRGFALDTNPHGQAPKARPSHNWTSPQSDSLSYEWDRGYRNTRKHARFNATIAARKAK